MTLASCTNASEVESSSPSSSPAGQSPSAASASPPPPCPNPEGGSCLGPLRPGQLYTTVEFDPAITYEVPREGWGNFEDLYGNFLLVPPRNDLAGVNPGTSDYIGAFRAVLPTTLTSPRCGADWPLGFEPGPTPEELLSYYRTQPNLVVSNVHQAEVGGRSGVVLDVRAAPGVPLDRCREGGTKVEVTQVLSGIEGSSFDHGVIDDMSMRLYLLRDHDRVMAIEITDIHSAPGTLDSMSRVAESLRFAP